MSSTDVGAMSQYGEGGGVIPHDGRAPRESLSEPAQALLDAARRLLLSGGFDALRLDAIVQEAGKHKAAVKYHFGSKDGLVLTLVETLDRERLRALAEELERTTDQSGRTYDEILEERVTEHDEFRMFYDLFPHVVRDERLAPRMGALYEWYRSIHVRLVEGSTSCRSLDADESDALAHLMVAVVDGLALQALLGSDKIRLRRAVKLWGQLLQTVYRREQTKAPTE